MKRMRILSLDFHGVLHPTADGAQRMAVTHFGWLPHLSRLLAPHLEVMLLVHSTWRHRYNLQELRLLLGDTLRPRVVAAAPDGDDRWRAIQAWAAAQTGSLDLLIIDDARGEFPTTMPFTLLVCDPSSGLSDLRVQHSIQRRMGSEQERRRSDDDAE
jgi:hypothetical protein